jgi:superfamily II DNA or RNA helicase
VRLANLLVIDEAHNYLNKSSTRSLSVATHRAEFIVLSTATPINKRAEDLLRLVQLLDPDNLDDVALQQFKELYRKPPKELEENSAVIQQLKSYIWKFTLRRTKTDLNRLINKEPGKYLNELNERCCYPEQKHHFYPTGETEKDIRIAEKIEELSANLKGLIYLRTLNFPKALNLDSREKRDLYLQGRLKTAKGLSRYRVQACLRSSRAALVEMIEGTKAAEIFASLPPIHKETGDIVGTLATMKEAMPQYPKEWDVLPDWLTDSVLFCKACEEEIKTYREILSLVKSMFESREKTKAKQLLSVMQKRSLVIAFDHTIVTLYCLQKLLEAEGVACYVVSGTDTAARQTVLESLALGSPAKNVVALCSDAVSEGVNLQAAPAVVMLDMPSVLRLAEQRIGRIDRLNSPHNRIHIYWPDDSKAFRLKADRKLIRTANITKQLMGSNLHLPEEEFLSRYDDWEAISAKALVEELEISREEQEKEWTGMKDAFETVRLLIEGPDALLAEKEYERMIGSNATVRCKLSFVRAMQRWAFIALRSSKESVSRWIFIDEKEDVITDFSIICGLLRQRLHGSEKAPFNETELKHFVRLFREKERVSLPHKKRRALEVAEAILQRQWKEETKKQNGAMIALLADVLDAFKPSDKEFSVDYSRFSVLWLDILSGWLKDWRSSKKRRRWLSLEDLIRSRQSFTFSQVQLEYILAHLPLTDPLDLQIAACIVGRDNK